MGLGDLVRGIPVCYASLNGDSLSQIGLQVHYDDQFTSSQPIQEDQFLKEPQAEARLAAISQATSLPQDFRQIAKAVAAQLHLVPDQEPRTAKVIGDLFKSDRIETETIVALLEKMGSDNKRDFYAGVHTLFHEDNSLFYFRHVTIGDESTYEVTNADAVVGVICYLDRREKVASAPPS